MLDPDLYPAAEIVELYHERWELELGFDEIKTHTLEGAETLRSKAPDRILQEIWGLAIGYNLMRLEMLGSAALTYQLQAHRHGAHLSFQRLDYQSRGLAQTPRATAPRGRVARLAPTPYAPLPSPVKIKMSAYRKKPVPKHSPTLTKPLN